MSAPACCLKGFAWDGEPIGHTTVLSSPSGPSISTYVTGTNPDRAVLLIHDLFGWTFPNIRLLADHYALEAHATVYVPDFFDGEVLPPEPIASMRWDEVDVPGLMKRNAREIREPEIFACARILRAKYKKLGAVGYCYGGWAVFRLGSKIHQPPLVDCITAGHPTFLTKHDISDVSVPTQVLAPEHDPVYTAELKTYTFDVMQKSGQPFDYEHFPGVEHACFVRGYPNIDGERDAMSRAKNSVVGWLNKFLLD